MGLGGFVNTAVYTKLILALCTQPPRTICKWSIVNKVEICLQVSLCTYISCHENSFIKISVNSIAAVQEYKIILRDFAKRIGSFLEIHTLIREIEI